MDLTINVLYINDCSFSHSIDQKIKFHAVVPLRRKKKNLDHNWEELYDVLKHILHFYNIAEKHMRTIHADTKFTGEFQEKVFDELVITMNFPTTISTFRINVLIIYLKNILAYTTTG